MILERIIFYVLFLISLCMTFMAYYLEMSRSPYEDDYMPLLRSIFMMAGVVMMIISVLVAFGVK